jgi:hypothetical protein
MPATACYCLLLSVDYRDKIRATNPAFLDTTLTLLFTHGMADHASAVEYVYGQLGRPLPQV